jgi:hypothetical protein
VGRLILSDRDRDLISRTLEQEANRTADVRLRDLAVAIRVADGVETEDPAAKPMDGDTVERVSDALYDTFDNLWREATTIALDALSKRRGR